MKINNLPDKEFKEIVFKMVAKLRKRIEEHSDNFNKDLEYIRKNQTEMKNTKTEMKNTLEGINSRLNDTEEWITKLEDRVVEITATEEKTKKNKWNEDSLRDLWNNIKCTNIHIIEVTEGEEREKVAENLFEEIITENISNLGKEIVNQV